MPPTCTLKRLRGKSIIENISMFTEYRPPNNTQNHLSQTESFNHHGNIEVNHFYKNYTIKLIKR